MYVKTLDSLNVPEQKNSIFVSPDFSSWPFLLLKNNFILQDRTNLLKSRIEILKLSKTFSKISFVPDRHRYIIVTGHQTTWHHCGILAKNYVAAKFAADMGGCCVHLMLDHDISDTAMSLPKYSSSHHWSLQKVMSDDNQLPLPLEFRTAPQQAVIEKFFNVIADTNEDRFCNEVWFKRAKLQTCEMPSFSNTADFITYLQAILNSALGIDMIYISVSELSASQAFLGFFASVAADALNFATSYNEAISEYIRKNKIDEKRAIHRLTTDLPQNLVETPFWLVSPQGKRASLYIKFEKGRYKIICLSNEIACIEFDCKNDKAVQITDILKQSGYFLRPKAVTLTLFVRLFLADWFIHGFGGAIYESITDHILENYYGVKGLGFGVATATMTLPLPRFDKNAPNTISKLKQQLRGLRFNPEKFIDVSVCRKEPLCSLIVSKNKLIKIAGDSTISSETKKSAWHEISLINEKLLKFAHKQVEDVRRSIKLAENQKLSQLVQNSREYFFGLFPEESLRKLLGEEIVKN